MSGAGVGRPARCGSDLLWDRLEPSLPQCERTFGHPGRKGVVEPRDVQLLDTRQRVMVRQAGVEREKRAKFVKAGGQSLPLPRTR